MFLVGLVFSFLTDAAAAGPLRNDTLSENNESEEEGSLSPNRAFISGLTATEETATAGDDADDSAGAVSEDGDSAGGEADAAATSGSATGTVTAGGVEAEALAESAAVAAVVVSEGEGEDEESTMSGMVEVGTLAVSELVAAASDLGCDVLSANKDEAADEDEKIPCEELNKSLVGDLGLQCSSISSPANNALLLLFAPRCSTRGANLLSKSAEEADMIGTDADAAATAATGDGIDCAVAALAGTADPPALPAEARGLAITSRSTGAPEDSTSGSSNDSMVFECEIKSATVISPFKTSLICFNSAK